MYYIYHIPGVKIGCSINPKERVRIQGYSNFEILEEYTDKSIAAKREIQLQKKYGYDIDLCKYDAVDYSSMGKAGGTKTKKTGKLKKHLENLHKKERTKKQLEQLNNARKNVNLIECGKKTGKLMRERLSIAISVYRVSDNSLVGIYSSYKECADALDINRHGIASCFSSKSRMKTHKGYKFEKI
jgi:hypothetical protein